jgi:NAD(P)-dependent dehydrogenase (short-subunit alcohol dehydrogenase family)
MVTGANSGVGFEVAQFLAGKPTSKVAGPRLGLARLSPAECARVRHRSEGTSLLASVVCLCADTLAVCSFAVSAPLFSLLLSLFLFCFPFVL